MGKAIVSTILSVRAQLQMWAGRIATHVLRDSCLRTAPSHATEIPRATGAADAQAMASASVTMATLESIASSAQAGAQRRAVRFIAPQNPAAVGTEGAGMMAPVNAHLASLVRAVQRVPTVCLETNVKTHASMQSIAVGTVIADLMANVFAARALPAKHATCVPLLP